MRMTGNRIESFAAIAVTLILGLYASAGAYAATCKDELDRFESRLHDSSLAAEDPDTYHALARQAEEAAELRDERQCLETVAALNDVVPEDANVQTSGDEESASGPADDKSTDTRPRSSRPAAPVLMMAGDDDAGESGEERKPAASGSGDHDSLND
jgi:hypothetical protein